MGKHKPFIKLGPGDTIRAELEFYGWDQADLAEILEVSNKHVSELINNKVPITFDMACRLSKVFKQSPQFWLNLDAQYRLRLQEDAEDDDAAARALVYRYMPVREMRRRKMLPKDNDKLIPDVLEFWGIETLNFDSVEKQAANFRKSEAHTQYNVFFALTWLQAVRNSTSRRRTVKSYISKGLRNLAENLTAYTVMDDGIEKFLTDLSSMGVIFAYMPHFEKTYTDGASFWHGNNPVLAYTGRYDRSDNFWFTIAHELGHILLHDGADSPVFIDSIDHLDRKDDKEREADDFAKRILKIPEILRVFSKGQRVSRVKVMRCAEILETHPSIVVGALQFAKKLNYKSLNDLKEPVRDRLIKLVEE